MNNYRSDTIDKKHISRWSLYYVLLGTIQALWTNLASFPPLPFRIMMIAASFFPVIVRRQLILLAIPFSITLRGLLSTGYQYIPDVNSYWFYIGIELLAICFHWRDLNFTLLRRVKPLFFLMLLFAIVDVFANNEVGKISIHIFIGLLLIPFFKEKDDFHFLSAAIMLACTILSIYYIVMFDKFLTLWSGDIERSGWMDPNYFSITLDMGFLVAIMYLLGFCKSDYTIFDKRIIAAACLIIASAVIMTASRAGFLCIAFTLLIALFFAKLKFWHFLLAILVIVGTGVYLYNKGAMEVLLFRLFEQGNLDTGGNRTPIWQLMMTNFSNQDLINQLFGGGYFHRMELTGGMDLHNEFLSILADYGLIGEVMYLSFVFSMFSFKKNVFWKQNTAVLFYILSVFSLSPFSYIFILFLIVWIYAMKFTNDDILIDE